MDLLDFSEYDRIILSFSGGKDSSACALYLLSLGIPAEKIWAWHQAIDGMGETKRSFFDWPSTEGYTKAFCRQFGFDLAWQWRAFGFWGELNRVESRTGDVYALFEDGREIYLPTTKGELTTRKMWPAKRQDLRYRWCSSSLKIDVAARVMNNVLPSGKFLFITGERRQESPGRAKYKEIELHRTHSSRKLVHHWRPVIDWKEQKVWDILESYQVQAHPVYYLGFPRLSCRSCVFFSADHWATLAEVDPATVRMLHQVEQDLDHKLDNKFTIPEMIHMGKSGITEENRHWIVSAVNEYSGTVITNNWYLPSGAYGSGGGSI